MAAWRRFAFSEFLVVSVVTSTGTALLVSYSTTRYFMITQVCLFMFMYRVSQKK